MLCPLHGNQRPGIHSLDWCMRDLFNQNKKFLEFQIPDCFSLLKLRHVIHFFRKGMGKIDYIVTCFLVDICSLTFTLFVSSKNFLVPESI